MESEEMRNMILSEIIENMQDRKAKKVYPDETEKPEEAAVVTAEEPAKEEAEDNKDEKDEDLTDADIDELMKQGE